MNPVIRWIIAPLGYLAAMVCYFGFTNGLDPAALASLTWIAFTVEQEEDEVP